MRVANVSNPFILCGILVVGIIYGVYILLKAIYILIGGLIQNAKQADN